MPSNETKKGLTRSSVASKNDAIDLERQPGGREKNSVYDFLYHDVRRIGSFLAQFETYGVLQNIKASDSTGRTTATKTGVAASGGIPSLAQGQAARDQTVTEDERDAAERTYDPFWTNARTFLDYLTDRDLIITALPKARIGQFVLHSGSLSLFDFSILKIAWPLPFIKNRLLTGMQLAESAESKLTRPERRRQGKGTTATDGAGVSDFAYEMLKLLPHTIQASLTDQNGSAWCILREESLVVSAADVLLKHGVSIPGSWNLLGVLDAFPISHQTDTEYAADQLKAAECLGTFGEMIGSLAPAIAKLLGRPPDSFGMTPLLIFREISG
jgi:hypothetical protein